MKLSLAFIGLALAFCAANVKADDVTAADVADLSIDQQILIAVALTNQTETVDPWAPSGLPPAQAEIAYNTSDSTVDVVIPDPVSKRAIQKTRYNLGNIAKKRQTTKQYTTVIEGQTASLSAPAYLTYKLLKSTEQSAAYVECEAYCTSVRACQSANVYQEFNNPAFTAPKNWKCALYGDLTVPSQLTNKGGQRLGGPGSGLTYISNSAIFNVVTLSWDLTPPPGYVKVFGPINGATSAGPAIGYMGYTALSMYDVAKCGALCNTRGADPEGGRCKFFNLWRAEVNGKTTTYTCSFFYATTDASTAVNYGQPQNGVTISQSVGYSLLSALSSDRGD